MSETWIQRGFAPFKRHLPRWLSAPIRNVATALLTPMMFATRTGHFRSSLIARAVDMKGRPIPWYTYGAIDLLSARDWSQRSVLEFGGGQSTLWWSQRAREVVTFDDDADWIARIGSTPRPNLTVHRVPDPTPGPCMDFVRATMSRHDDAAFDVIVVDGLCRNELMAEVDRWIKPDGVIICDNSEECMTRAIFLGRGYQRVDFFGFVPGCVLQTCTSMYFRPGAFVFQDHHFIPFPWGPIT